ncbi:MAG: phage minor tail protein L [Holophagales bacterium]|nr:phage minor tail protein L [Holophagales bacterium]MYG30089.1 phage minor tail protein L [Holophagales bacterium]MYI78777.1 phage minor tail protein L [Holophagales bacterium]
MTSQTFTAEGTVDVGLRIITFNGLQINLASGLVQGGGAAVLELLRIASTTGEVETADDADLTAAWERSAVAITLALGEHSATVFGPNHPGSFRDDSAPYLWLHGSSSAVIALVIAAGAGTHTFTITLDDGVTGTTVTANAGADKSVASGGTVRLDGSATVQNAEGATTYAWRRVSGSGGSLDDATAQRPTFTAPALARGAADRPIVFELVATNNDVSSAGDQVTITVTAPALAAPSLSGTSGDASARLTWTAVTGATGYQRRHKRTSSSSWGSWASAGSNRVQTYGSLVNGVSYDFQVRATSAAQQGPPSNTLTLTPEEAVPDTPAAPDVDVVYDDVTVSWTEVARDSGGYDIQRRTGASGAWATIASDVDGSSYVDRNRPPGTYYYRIRAGNGGGHSGYSGASDAAVATAPPPTTVVADAGSDKTVASGGTVRLDGSATVANGEGATTYAWRRVSGSGGVLNETDPQRPTYHAPTLQPGSDDLTIVYELRATNNGVTSAGDRVTITVTAPPPPTTVVANAGPDKTVGSRGTVRLAGSATVQNAQGETTWAWSRISGTGGSLDDATAQEPTFTAPALERGGPSRAIVFELVATNNGVASAGDRVTITVTAPAPVAALGTRLDAGPIIDLFTVKLQGGAVERYTSGPHGSDSVMYGGQTYRPLPITLEHADFRAKGAFSRPTLRVSLLDRSAVPVDWQGATIERVRTLARYLDGEPEADPDRHWPQESWVVDRLSSRGREELSWQLSAPLDLQLATIPRRQVLRDVCQWEYRRRVGGAWVNPPADDGCPYRGTRADGGPFWNAQDESVSNASQDVCSRRLSGCELRFGENGDLPFGGFAGVSQLRR